MSFCSFKRLLFQQNVGQVTTYGSGSHSLLEGTLSHHHHQRQQQQQAPLNCGFNNSGGDVPSSSSTAACRHIQTVGGEGFCELDSALLSPNPVAPGSQTQSLVNQRTPLEDFSRRMKEIAPNVRVSPTGYHYHFPVPSLYPPDRQQQHQQQQQQRVSHFRDLDCLIVQSVVFIGFDYFTEASLHVELFILAKKCGTYLLSLNRSSQKTHIGFNIYAALSLCIH